MVSLANWSVIFNYAFIIVLINYNRFTSPCITQQKKNNFETITFATHRKKNEI